MSRPKLPVGWGWDEHGRAVGPFLTVSLEAGHVRIVDLDDEQTCSAPAAVVRAVVAGAAIAETFTGPEPPEPQWLTGLRADLFEETGEIDREIVYRLLVAYDRRAGPAARHAMKAARDRATRTRLRRASL
jgi:hypothetical protein